MLNATIAINTSYSIGSDESKQIELASTVIKKYEGADITVIFEEFGLPVDNEYLLPLGEPFAVNTDSCLDSFTEKTIGNMIRNDVAKLLGTINFHH